MNTFNIKDLENLSGVKAHTIRIWEQRYNFLKPKRTQTNIRCYCNDELRTLLNIALLNKHGYKISQIDKMSRDEICRKVISLEDDSAIQERIANELVTEMAELNMDKFEAIIDRYIHGHGMEMAMLNIIFPFLEKIGILWQTGHIHPAQEHLVSNIIRQKIIAAIESAPFLKNSGQSFLLFLPEGEQHELGLLFVYYLLKSRGARVLYLGANVPVTDVEKVVKLKQPGVLITHLTAPAGGFTIDKFIRQAGQLFEDRPLIISGSLIQEYKKKLPGGIKLKASFREVMDYISTV